MRLRTRLLAALAYVLLLAIVSFGVPLALTLSARVSDEVRSQARSQADLVAATAADLLGGASRTELVAVVRNAASSVHGRVLVVNRRGVVLADSAGPAQVGASYESRPELERALLGHAVQVQRDSKTLHQEILATAVPILHRDHVAGAVRITQSVRAVHQAVLRVELELLLIGLVVLILGLVAGSILARQIGRPMVRLQEVARRVAQGDLRARADVEGSREQRFLARAFNDMTERITRLVGVQQRFVADASHQLRTPLTGLRLRLEEARAATGEPAAREELDAAIGEVDRLSQIVNELLELSRDRKRHVEAAPVELRGLASDAVRRWSREAKERGIAIRHEPADRPSIVWASRRDLERALDALIDNALRYSPRGTTVTVLDAQGRIEVRDRGHGISAEDQRLVFDRFHRGAAGRMGPAGHGLGLPIARELARAWGGEVTVADREGGGTCALLSLPTSPAGDEAAPSEFARA